MTVSLIPKMLNKSLNIILECFFPDCCQMLIRETNQHSPKRSVFISDLIMIT